MTKDSKTDELNLCENFEPECQPEDSKPVKRRAQQKHRNGADERPDEDSRLADAPLAVSPDADSSHKEGDDSKELQGVEPNVVQSTDASTDPSGPPFDQLLVTQLIMTVHDWETGHAGVDGAVRLYENLKPVDAIESVFARLAVGFTNATMEGLQRAARIAASPAARQMELKLSQKSAATVVEVLLALERHRGLDRKNVNVGSVNVGSGGKAIVGNVRSVPKSDQDEE